jgi:hypothetical protein
VSEPNAEPSSPRDPHGTIECEDCDRIGYPPGGVLIKLVGHQVTKQFRLPDGWALRDFTLICERCARERNRR